MNNHDDEPDDDVVLFEAPPASAEPPGDDATSRRIIDRFLAHPRLSGIGAVASIVALVLAILAATGASSDGGASKTTAGQPVSEAPPKNAVDEIAKRPIWSSPPITYPEANKAVDSKEPLPTAGEEITSAPKAILVTKFASESENSARTENYMGEYYQPVVAVVGKVTNVETLTSKFVGSRDEERSGPYPITQVEFQVVGGDAAVYAEFPEVPVSRNDVLIGVGRVAAIGSTNHNRIKAIYLLGERAEKLEETVDSNALRELYKDARRGVTEEQAEKEKDEKALPHGGGISLFP
jgi:hypothetical protein